MNADNIQFIINAEQKYQRIKKQSSYMRKMFSKTYTEFFLNIFSADF